ncbi:hypothetical protein LPJ81_004189 [Coemansia sp. IMI 209127]|nr:hypothetical protein LPJ81_004189 [Coemansia sp. IMI 209127]
MRLTFVARAKAQYQWHKHVPRIRFVGPRKSVWKTEQQHPTAASAAAATETAAAGTGGSATAEAINFWELPARYRPLPMSEAEIEAVESGGASTY